MFAAGLIEITSGSPLTSRRIIDFSRPDYLSNGAETTCDQYLPIGEKSRSMEVASLEIGFRAPLQFARLTTVGALGPSWAPYSILPADHQQCG